MNNGFFITFEGPEGGGKSTHISMLIERLSSDGYEVLSAREPGGTKAGEAIRDILQHDTVDEEIFPETETLLFGASRAQLVRAVIKPALEQGKCFICDRFIDSTTVYQGFGRNQCKESISAINEFAISGCVPDLTVLLDIDVKHGFERIETRIKDQNMKRDRFEREALSFHEKVRAGYLELAGKNPDRIKVVDASADVEVVFEKVWQVVKEAMDLKGLSK